MTRALFAIMLFVAVAPASAREKLAHVPFVGCPSDGQTGPIPAPRPFPTPALQARVAARLAYYATDDATVLAPRGWYCVGLYGSSGQSLIVTPQRHKTDAFFESAPVPIRGPAVQMSVSFGGTSGRLSVIPAIDRYFPRYRAFSHEMRKLDPDIMPPPARPWRTDLIRRRTASYIRFTTPAGMQGEGTHSFLLPGKDPIDGIRMIVGSVQEPDLVSATVRLPANQSDLAELILAEAAK